MKLKIFPSACLLLIFVIPSSCIPAEETISTSVIATKTFQISSTSSAPSSKDETPTPKTSPTVTMPVLTLAPTLNADNAFESLMGYLKNEKLCRLPCWWGITPGKSTLSDVQKLLANFSGISKRTYFGEAGNSWIVGNLDIDFDEEDSVIGIRTSYLVSSPLELVSFIGIDAVSLPKNAEGHVFGDKNYNELLFAYTLPQIVSTYGVPVKTFITAEIYVAEPTAPDYFVIRLLYPHLGMFLRYRMPVETDNNIYKFCPSQSVVYLDLIPQEYGNDYKDYFEQIGSAEWDPAVSEIPFYKSIEEAIGITNDEFYRLNASSPTTCFESPIEIWPEP